MEYLYLYLEKKQAAVLNFPEEWSVLEEAIHVDIPTLRRNVAQIGYKLKMIKSRIDRASNHIMSGNVEGDKFSDVMLPFQGFASIYFSDLKKAVLKVLEELSALAVFLGDAEDQTATFLKTLFNFRKEFMRTARQCAVKRQIEEKRRKTQLWKARRGKAYKTKKETIGAQRGSLMKLPKRGVSTVTFDDFISENEIDALRRRAASSDPTLYSASDVSSTGEYNFRTRK